MKQLLLALTLLGVLILSQPSDGWEYFSLTDQEFQNIGGEEYYFRYFGRDTLWERIHSNGWIRTQNVDGLPVFADIVSTSMPSFHPLSPNPAGQFLDGAPIFNAPEVVFPDSLQWIRQAAREQWHERYFSIPGEQWSAVIEGTNIHLGHWPVGTMRPSWDFYDLTLVIDFHSSVVFIDGDVELRGELAAQDHDLILGASGDIRIMDNIMLEGTNVTTGALPNGATSKLCIASEGSVIVGNTWENGRENQAQGEDVVITALIFALSGSFQFEQMNDTWDNYVTSVSPDERGTIVLTGGITQRVRGFTHRSNRNGTGYNRVYHWDERMRDWNPGVFNPFINFELPDSFIFADTPVGTTVFDTLRVEGIGPFSGAQTNLPFTTDAEYQFSEPEFVIPLTFTPPYVGPHYGMLHFFLDGQFHAVQLFGSGLQAGGPLAVKTDVYPNPFNTTSTLRFTIPQAGNVRVVVYDILGRESIRLTDQVYSAGEHTLMLDGTNLASGVYFLSFEALGKISTHKLLLLK